MLWEEAYFVVDRSLFPEDSLSGLELDALHAEERLAVLEKYLVSYCDYIINLVYIIED